MRLRRRDVGGHARQRLGAVDEELDARSRRAARTSRSSAQPPAGGVERAAVADAAQAAAVMRADRALDAVAERVCAIAAT